MKRYKIYDYSAGGRALESYNILNDLVYYFGYYMCNKDSKSNVNWNGVGDDIFTSNCTAHYHYRNAALSHITRLIFDKYGFYISNRKAKRYLQTFHGVPVKSDTLFGLFMNELLQETLLYPSLSSFFFERKMSNCIYYTPSVDTNLKHSQCIHYLAGFEFELLIAAMEKGCSAKKLAAIKECLDDLTSSIEENKISDRCRMRRGG